MAQQPQEAPAKKRRPKDFAQIAGSCKMAKLSDGYKDAPASTAALSASLKSADGAVNH